MKKRIIELNNQSSSNQMFLRTSSRFEVCRALNERCEEEKRGVRTFFEFEISLPEITSRSICRLEFIQGNEKYKLNHKWKGSRISSLGKV